MNSLRDNTVDLSENWQVKKIKLFNFSNQEFKVKNLTGAYKKIISLLYELNSEFHKKLTKKKKCNYKLKTIDVEWEYGTRTIIKKVIVKR